MIKKNIPLLSLTLLTALSGCDTSAIKTNGNINQDDICQVKDWSLDSTMQTCKQGQKVAFLPDSFGNEQLPILFSAVNCDLRYSVALTNGGVTCIYNPIKPKNSAQK